MAYPTAGAGIASNFYFKFCAFAYPGTLRFWFPRRLFSKMAQRPNGFLFIYFRHGARYYSAGKLRFPPLASFLKTEFIDHKKVPMLAGTGTF